MRLKTAETQNKQPFAVTHNTTAEIIVSRADAELLNMDKLIKEIRDFACSRWTLGALHGVHHWDRVYRNGQLLMTPEVNPLVVGLFAYLHDSCRENDGADMEHGPRAAEWLGTIRNTYLKEISDDEFFLLQEACRLHTTMYRTGNPTIDACFDADRLDLWRVGITPDPERLATERGKDIARNTDYEPLINSLASLVFWTKKEGKTEKFLRMATGHIVSG